MINFKRTTVSPAPTGTDRSVACKRLMAAVLQTVLDDCRGSTYRRARGLGRPIGRRSLRMASDYVASRDRTWPFSFENLCDALEIDANGVRVSLRAGFMSDDAGRALLGYEAAAPRRA